MDDYKKPYLTLFNAVTDAIEQLEAQKFDLTLWNLEKTQQDAEKQFISEEPGQ